MCSSYNTPVKIIHLQIRLLERYIEEWHTPKQSEEVLFHPMLLKATGVSQRYTITQTLSLLFHCEASFHFGVYGPQLKKHTSLKVKFEDVCSSVALKPIHPGNAGACVVMVRRPTAPWVPPGGRESHSHPIKHSYYLCFIRRLWANLYTESMC